MADINSSLADLLTIDGSKGACIVDYASGMMLGSQGAGVDLELAAAGNSEVVKAKMDTMKKLGISGDIEDMLITLEDQMHIIRPAHNHEGLFIYLVLDKAKANLALARRKVTDVDKNLEV